MPVLKKGVRAYNGLQPDPEAPLKIVLLADGQKYVPIQNIEETLDATFQKWHMDIKSVQIVGNSAIATITLHVCRELQPPFHMDGVGAFPLETLPNGNFTVTSIQQATPAAVSIALKNAAARMGERFGRGINREDFSIIQGEPNPSEDILPRLKAAIDACITRKQLQQVWAKCGQNPDWWELFEAKNSTLEK